MGFFSGLLSLVIFFFNFVLFIGAICSIYLGIFSEYPIRIPDEPDDDESFELISNIILFISIFIAVLSLIGCYGVATNNKFYLLLYSTTLLLLIVIQLILCFGVQTKFSSVKGDMESKFVEIIKNQTLNHYNTDDFIHRLQRKHGCCGFESYEDWNKILDYIPGSCCSRSINQSCSPAEVFLQPSCEKIIKQRMEMLKMSLLYFIIAVFIFEGVLSTLAICMVMRRD